jgi:cytochrome c oxidase cbb3-type subunit 3
MNTRDQTLHDKPIEGHEYDGIQELNNPLPRWWLATFFATIVFAVLYWGYYQIGKGPSLDERLSASMARINAAQADAQKAAGGDETIDANALLADPKALAVGKAQFDSKCTPCHGAAGEGLVGPNLTDNYWIHSRGDIHGILSAIRNGFPEKGMPPWGAIVPPEEQAPLAAYVMSLRGTNPPNAKEPQGDLVQ